MPSKTPSRPEGEKWFEWPLTPASVGMTSAELIGELYETISTLNRDRGWNLTMVAPARFGEIVIDREAGCLRAKCAWKAKDPSQLGPEPAGYVRGISIHTPLAGSDADVVVRADWLKAFQSTLPLRGATAEMRHF